MPTGLMIKILKILTPFFKCRLYTVHSIRGILVGELPPDFRIKIVPSLSQWGRGGGPAGGGGGSTPGGRNATWTRVLMEYEEYKEQLFDQRGKASFKTLKIGSRYNKIMKKYNSKIIWNHTNMTRNIVIPSCVWKDRCYSIYWRPLQLKLVKI